jgi:hypothetical protein
MPGQLEEMLSALWIVEEIRVLHKNSAIRRLYGVI